MMLWSLMFAASALAETGPATPVAVTVAIDSSKHELTITAGPYDLPNMPPMEDHAMMDLGMSHDTPVQHFAWPVDGWFRGFRVDLVDAKGQPMPRHVMHHLIMVNFSRRQLLYSAAERLMGAGTETDEEISVPKTIGVPMTPGMKLGMYVAWHNETGKELEGVFLKLTMLWTPKAHEFTLPVGGRLLGVGGHKHDYGVGVRLEDAETGKVITRVVATRDS